MPAAATVAMAPTLSESMAMLLSWTCRVSSVSAAVPVLGELGAHHAAGGGVHLDRGVGAVLVRRRSVVPGAGLPARHVDDVAGAGCRGTRHVRSPFCSGSRIPMTRR